MATQDVSLEDDDFYKNIADESHDINHLLSILSQKFDMLKETTLQPRLDVASTVSADFVQKLQEIESNIQKYDEVMKNLIKDESSSEIDSSFHPVENVDHAEIARVVKEVMSLQDKTSNK